jgi:hypothetical protein
MTRFDRKSLSHRLFWHCNIHPAGVEWPAA